MEFRGRSSDNASSAINSSRSLIGLRCKEGVAGAVVNNKQCDGAIQLLKFVSLHIFMIHRWVDFQQLMGTCLSKDTSAVKFSRRSDKQFLREVANRQTDRQINSGYDVASLVKVAITQSHCESALLYCLSVLVANQYYCSPSRGVFCYCIACFE